MGVVMLECTRTNDFCKYSKAVVLLGKNVIGWTGINELIEIGLLKIPITGFYVVTPEGEYFLRSIETNLSRIVHDLPLSKWKKINAENDLRLKFVRGNQKPNTV